MSGRFFGGRAARSFNTRFGRNLGVRRFGGVPKKRVVFVNNNRRRARRGRSRNDSGAAKRTETLQTFKVYAGTLKKEGLKISIGPEREQFGNTSLCTAALNFNNYRPVKVSLEYTPLLNQTKASGMINSYLTTDIKADIPKDDIGMKNSTVNHKGVEWFSANRNVVRFQIPVLKQNVYETGSGDVNGNSEYEEAGYIIVKPTSTTEADIISYGELYLHITVAFSGPATPLIGTTTYAETGNVLKKDEVFDATKTDKDLLELLFTQNYAKYFCPNYSTSSYRDINVWYNTISDEIAFGELPRATFSMFSDKARTDDTYYTWDTDKQEWAETAYESPKNVRVINHVALGQNSTYNLRDKLHNNLKADSIPTHNKITDDTDVTHVLIEDQPILVNIQDQPILVNVADTPLDVNVVNKELDVNVVNEVDSNIINQPIDVHTVKGAGEQIWDILKAVATIVVRDGSEDEEVSIDDIDEETLNRITGNLSKLKFDPESA